MALQDKKRYEEEMKRYTPAPSAVGDASEKSAKKNKESVTSKDSNSKTPKKNKKSTTKKTTKTSETKSSVKKKTKSVSKKLNTILWVIACLDM